MTLNHDMAQEFSMSEQIYVNNITLIKSKKKIKKINNISAIIILFHDSICHAYRSVLFRLGLC